MVALLLAAILAVPVSQGRTGTVTHMGDGYPADYLAIPIGPGHRVQICNSEPEPDRCLTLTSTDAGPNRASLLKGRIADVSVQLFRKLCCDPSHGTFQGYWRLATIPLPATDTIVPNRKDRADVAR